MLLCTYWYENKSRRSAMLTGILCVYFSSEEKKTEWIKVTYFVSCDKKDSHNFLTV